MNQEEIRRQMEEVVQLFREEIATLRTGRATPALIEGIVVSVYGGDQKMKLMELGSILVEGPRTLVFQPWDKSIINEIKNGLLEAGMGLNPVVDKDKIRINLPPLTSEQRENYLKLLGRKLEAARVMIRDIRGRERHRLQEQLQQKEISEDEYYRLEKELQQITDDYITQLEAIAGQKKKDILCLS